MHISLSYTEVRRFIENQYQKEVGIQYVDPQTISLSYSIKRFLPTAHVKIKVESVSEESVILTYDGSAGIKLLLKGVLHFLDKKTNDDIINIRSDKKLIQIRLSEIEKAQKSFEYITPSLIYFDPEEIHIECLLK